MNTPENTKLEKTPPNADAPSGLDNAVCSPFSPSHVEEMIAGIYWLVAFMAIHIDAPKWICLIFLFKAVSDTYQAIKLAIKEVRAEKASAL